MEKKTKKIEPKQGWSIHCSHDKLVEWCYDYNKRIEYIKNYKPINEQETRLRLFKILSKEAVEDIPVRYQEAYKAWDEAGKAWSEAGKAWSEAGRAWCGAYEAWREAGKAWREAGKARYEAGKAWDEAGKACPQKDKDEFHKKWCGCKEWDGEKLVF